MSRLIVEQIISADGYAAEPDGGIGFFYNASGINDVDREQLRLLESVRAIVLGRRTFEMFAAYWPHADPVKEPVAVPINATPKYVVSNTLDSARWGEGSAEVLRGDGVASVQDLRRRTDGDMMIWGSLTLTDALLRAGEVDVLRLRIIAKVIGRGRSFTPPDIGHRIVVRENVASYEGGIVVLQYGFPK